MSTQPMLWDYGVDPVVPTQIEHHTSNCLVCLEDSHESQPMANGTSSLNIRQKMDG